MNSSYAPILPTGALLAVTLCSSAAPAHVFKQSYATAEMSADTLKLAVTLDPDDFGPHLRTRFDTDRSGNVVLDELSRHLRVIGQVVMAEHHVHRGEQRCVGAIKRTQVDAAKVEARVFIEYTCTQQRPWRIEATLLKHMRPGHTHFLTVGRGREATTVPLTESNPSWRHQSEATATGKAGRFFSLGFNHILKGYDHLLFLLALVLVCLQFRELLYIVTAFTVGHSMALLAAATGVLLVPASIVEPAIALSIAYVGIENVWVKQPRRRWALTLGLGLIHGLGFAGAVAPELQSSGSVSAAALMGLLTFNLGVEAGQMLFLLIVVPGLIALRREDPRPWIRAAIVTVSGAASLWVFSSNPAVGTITGLATAWVVFMSPRWGYARAVRHYGSLGIVVCAVSLLLARL